MEQRVTFEQVIQAVCNEMGLTPKELKEVRHRSNPKLFVAKAICTYLLKMHSLGSNNQIKKALGYSSSGTKTIRYNKAAMQNYIETADEMVMAHFSNINYSLFGDEKARVYKREELEHMRLNVVNQRTIDMCTALNVYPFVIRTCNMLFNSYGVDKNGVYIGQSESEYKAAML